MQLLLKEPLPMMKEPDRSRTLFLSEVYPPLIGGTANKFSSRFADCCPSDVVVVTKQITDSSRFDNSVGYRIVRIDFKDLPWKGFQWVGQALSMVRAARALRRRTRFELIECARPIPEGFAGWILSKLWRIPLVVNVQGEDISVMSRYRVERWVMQRLLKAAKLNIGNSRFTEDLIQSLAGNHAKTAIIHPSLRAGIEKWDRNVDSDAVNRLRKQIDGQPIVLTAGRLQSRKGHDNLIRALPMIRHEFPNIRYVIVGSDQGGEQGYRGRLERLIEELGLSENARVVGEVNNEELGTYYRACDLFAMPNRTQPDGDVEGFGQVFLEAGYFGKAVVGGRSGGVPDSVIEGQTGMLVDGNSPSKIAETILALLRDPSLRTRLGQNGKAFADGLCSQSVANLYHETIAEILEPKRRPSLIV
jgi:phosphatidyl-myo-inositol dimannoside synthase